MSAFIVEDKTISNIVNWINRNLDECYEVKQDLIEMGYNLDSVNWQDKLAQDLFDLNVKGVGQRYSQVTPDKQTKEDWEKEAKEFRPLNFKYDPTYLTDSAGVFKSTGCLSYQCAEGDNTENKLYLFLEKLENTIAKKIVYKMPSYDMAIWG